MTPASKGAQVKRVPASRPAAATTSRAGNKKTPAKVKAAATKRPAPTKKKAAPVVKKAAPAAKKAAPSAKKSTVASKKAVTATAKKSVTAKKAAPPAKKSAPVAKKAAPAKKAPAASKTAAEKPAAKKAAASAVEAAVIVAPRTTFTPKPKAPPPVRPKTGPYAKDLKFLEEVHDLLVADRAIYQEQATSLRAEADSLALEREPGDVQFDEESGEGGTVTVDRERNLALSGQASLAVEEIDYALERIEDKTYGYCERCFQPIPKPRLRALPYARLCVACKSGGLSRR
jgi:RNA polymerase-binding transcription factor DksA